MHISTREVKFFGGGPRASGETARNKSLRDFAASSVPTAKTLFRARLYNPPLATQVVMDLQIESRPLSRQKRTRPISSHLNNNNNNNS